MLLPITLTLAATCALLNFWLATRCVRLRLSEKALHGDGGSPLLARRMRAHGNFTEYTPIVIILFGLIELAVGSSIWLWAAALVYVLARIGHGIGMDREQPNWLRGGGAMMTWTIMIGLAIAAIVVAYSATRAVPAPPAYAARV